MGSPIPNRSVLDWPTGVSVYKPEKCYGGYTVVTPYQSDLIFLVDMLGRVVHTWRADPEPTIPGMPASWFLRRLANGNWMTLNVYFGPGHGRTTDLIPNIFSDPPFDTAVLELNWDGDVVWRYQVPSGWAAHHDMARLANGNTLIALDEAALRTDISEKPISDNLFVEVDRDGNVVWQWATRDHVDEFGYSRTCRELMYAQGGDVFHTNTCSPLPGNALEFQDNRFAKGNILSCQRHVNLIYIIDKGSENVVWTWGDEPGQLVGPHHPTMLGNGNILIYDNGGQGGYPARCRFYTRLVEVDPVSREIVWEYAHDPTTRKPMSKFFSSSWGSVQRLPNGNTFSLDCHKGRLFEITPSGEIVWEYQSPFSWGRGVRVTEPGIYRAYRYGYEDIPQVDISFPGTDGHEGVQPASIPVPKQMGLPSTDPA